MKRILITHPVLGVIVTAMIGMGCLGATQPTTRGDIIRPGEGVGPITLGMTEAELDDAIGKPATAPWDHPATVREYAAKGMTILMSKAEPRTVAAILGGRGEGVLNTIMAAPFPWRTAESLGMGSTVDDLTAAYGKPESDRSDANTNWRLMIYSQLGIQFGLRDGQVVWIAVRKPNP
jgi:hypothetical protein